VTWDCFIETQKQLPYYQQLESQIQQGYETSTCYPTKENIFRAFKLCEYEKVRVVILGQDPYHELGQADGLAFSCLKKPLPSSLRNIFKEINKQLDILNTNGDLSSWAKQGVLLLNTILSVQEGIALSHKHFNYHVLIEQVFNLLEDSDELIIYLLWGKKAQSYQKLITNRKHLVLSCGHPSGLSYSKFKDNMHFVIVNQTLSKYNYPEIDWRTY
jgi:uracil-DNA glycosylase